MVEEKTEVFSELGKVRRAGACPYSLSASFSILSSGVDEHTQYNNYVIEF